eukprot:30706-Pelagococcus_subviridis.AAC.9
MIIAKRSKTCSRTSPSSGLNVAIVNGRHGCVTLMFSRSTRFTPSPPTATDSAFASESSSRFRSSRYSTPLCARARHPGRNTGRAAFTDASTSIVPVSMPSSTASGTVTNGAGLVSRHHAGSAVIAARIATSSDSASGQSAPATSSSDSVSSQSDDATAASARFATTVGVARSARRALAATDSRSPLSHAFGSPSGSALHHDPGTTSRGGRSACVARARTVLHVPRPP